MKTYAITPVPKPRMTKQDRWIKRPCTQRYWAFKDEVRKHGIEIPQPCKIIFYMPMPSSWSANKKLLMAGIEHTQKPDVDNLGKALLDAVFDEDEHIWSLWIEKRWGTHGLITIEGLE